MYFRFDMENPKLIQLVKALSEQEIKEVLRYLSTPFHNTDANVVALFKAVCKYYPQMEDARLTKAALFQQVFKSKAYDDKKLRKLMSKLTGNLQNFMIMKETQETGQYRQLLIQAFARRGAQQLFEQETKAGILQCETNRIQGIAQYRELAWYYHQWHFNSGTGQAPVEDSKVVPALENIERFSALAILEYYLEILIRRKTRDEPAQPFFAEPVRRFASLQPVEKHPVIALFFQLQELYTGDGDAPRFKETYHLYLDMEPGLSRFERQLAWKILCQYLIRQSNDGSVADSRILFDLYKSGLEKGMMPEQELINKKTFTNIAISGIMVSEFEWTLTFVERYNKWLDIKEQEPTKDLVMAFWNYYRAAVVETESEALYKEASRLLQRIPYSDEIFYLRIYSLKLRLNYDYDLRRKNNPLELARTLKNFKRYLDGKTELSNEPAERYRQFAAFLEKLAKLTSPEKEKLQAIANALAEAPNVAFRQWLLHSSQTLMQKG